MSFAAPARLEVVVGGYAGSALEGRPALALAVESDQRASSRRRGESLSAEGVKVFDAVEPGEYVLTMHLGGRNTTRRSSSDGQVVHSQSIRLVSGPNSVRLSLPVLYEVVVSHPDAEPGSTMQLASAADRFGARQADIGSDGSVVFEDVAAGRYTLQCGDPAGQMEIDVPCGTVRFQAQLDMRDGNRMGGSLAPTAR